MTTTRKLQWNSTVKIFFSVIPKQIVDALGLKKGDRLQYSLVNNKITITPEVTKQFGSAGNE